MKSFTRDELSNLRELDLQKKVLVPLFKAMGFRGVTVWGGGSLELGKDIVMWKRGELDRRINYGVVVKAEKISGKAVPGKGTASEVYFQITQCLTTPYIDLVSTEEQPVHQCWVVSSNEITKEAKYAIKGQLRATGLERVTEFIDGDKLWELIREYMPEVGIFEQLDTVQKKIDDLVKSDHYRLVANTKHEFLIETKYPGAEKDQPLVVSGSVRFDRRDPAGARALQDWIRHIKTGAPITLNAPHLQEVKLPEFLQELIKPTPNMALTIGPRRSDTKTFLKILLQGANGHTMSLDYLEFETVQRGTEEATLSNDRQSVPWKVEMIINFHTGRWNIKFGLHEGNLNVSHALEVLKLQRVLASGGQLKIINLLTGLEFPVTKFNATGMEPDERWMRLLEELVFIQQKTFVPITVPDGDIDPEEAQRILVTAEILRTGQANLEVSHWPVTSPLSKAKEAAKVFAGESVHDLTMNDQSEHVINVLGTDIRLGPAVFFCAHAFMRTETLDQLTREIEIAHEGATLNYQLETKETVQARFLNWLPEDEAEKIRKLPIW